MRRFQTHRGLDASPAPIGVGRRGLLMGALALGLAGCGQGVPMTASTTPPLKMDQLNAEAEEIARGAGPAVLGAGLMNLESGEAWTLHGERPFPMQSVFKAPLAAAALAEVDAGRLSLNEILSIEETDLSPPYSPIADAWPGRRDYTVGELLEAALGGSDNTAADLLMRRIGGPGAVSAWLTGKKLDEVRVDRYERELQPQIVGLSPFRPAWRGEANYLTAMAAVPPPARRAAMARYLTDPRDTATPRGMLTFLQQLDSGELISPASTRLMLRIMQNTPSAPGRLKAGLPAGAALAHKSGTARTDLGVCPAVNDVGIATLPNKRSYAMVAFLSGATLDEAARDAVLANLARAMVRSLG